MTSPVKADPDFRHKTPRHLREALDADSALKQKWNNLTDLARNEWICWSTNAKQQATNDKRFARLVEEVKDGKRRPCCWPGCPHRNAKAAQYFD